MVKVVEVVEVVEVVKCALAVKCVECAFDANPVVYHGQPVYRVKCVLGSLGDVPHSSSDGKGGERDLLDLERRCVVAKLVREEREVLDSEGNVVGGSVEGGEGSVVGEERCAVLDSEGNVVEKLEEGDGGGK